MLVNECNEKYEMKSMKDAKVMKSMKDAKFGQCLYLWVPLCYEQNRCPERTLHHLQLKHKLAHFAYATVVYLNICCADTVKMRCSSSANYSNYFLHLITF